MPKWIPTIPKFHSQAERLVYGLLNTQLEKEWLVVSSHETLNRGKRLEMGEVDFLLLHPKHGLFVLEVKGGRMDYNLEEGWVTIDRDDKRYSCDPVYQGRSNLGKILKELEPVLGISLTQKLPHGFGCVFPQCHFKGTLPPGAHYGSSDVESGEGIIWDDRCLENIGQVIEKALNRWTGKNHTSIHFEKAQSEALLDHFRLTTLWVERSQKFDLLIDRENMEQATLEQVKAFDFLKRWKRALVKGVAGSGKTSVALAMAKSHLGEGKRVLYLCYNKSLAQAIRHQCKSLTSDDPLAEIKMVVLHFHELCAKAAEMANIEFSIQENESAANFWNIRTALILFEAIESLDLRFDTLIIDEAQDFRKDWWEAIRYLLADEKSTWHIYYDPHQNIYGTSLMLPDLNVQEIELNVNCRNAFKIMEKVLPFYTDVEMSAPADQMEGAYEDWGRFGKEEQKVEVLEDKFSTMIEQGITPNQIAILGRHQLANSPLRTTSALAGIPITCDIQEWMKNKGVLYTTFHAFKGLEADVVILFEVIKPCDKFPESLLINGMSRACHRLYQIS